MKELHRRVSARQGCRGTSYGGSGQERVRVAIFNVRKSSRVTGALIQENRKTMALGMEERKQI